MSTTKKDPGTPTNAEARAALEGLLYQVYETELGGVQVYTKALECVRNPDLRKEFSHYLEETKKHVEIAKAMLTEVGLDPEAEVPARLPVRTIGEGLVAAMDKALSGGTPTEAELTAAECVVEAETKDHMNWSLVGVVAKKTSGSIADALKKAHDQVEGDEDHHLYHSTGWAREMWIQALGLPAVLPPPEEQKHVETAIGAARAKGSRDEMAKTK